MFPIRFISKVKCLNRAISTKCCVDMSVDREGIATLSLESRTVNSISLKVLQDLQYRLDEVQKNECKGIVLTSALPRIFSAGLDIFEFHKVDSQKMAMFYTALQDLFLKLYASPYISTVAINGYAGAGACVVSMLCDYRVIVNNDNGLIGLNDTVVGIVPGYWVRELMIRTIGRRQAEIAITSSKMYTVDEALKIHLVDETASDQNEAIEKCKQYIRRFDKIPAKARIEAKQSLRGEFVRQFDQNRRDDLKAVVEKSMDPDLQRNITMYVEGLKQRKK